jgi:hypothetical protein
MNKRAQLYYDLLEQSKSQNAENIISHKRRTANIRASLARRRAPSKHRRALPKVPLDFLAIGDSWFDYPLYDNGPILEQTSIVAPVQLGVMGSPNPQILDQALHGQTTTQMLSWENQQKLAALLQDSSQWLNEETGLPDAILVSAGGDNLVGDQFVIYLDYGGGGLNLARFQGALAAVQASYMDLFAFRDFFAKKGDYTVPIIGICYDYALPNGTTPMCIFDAWLKPSFDFLGYFDYNYNVQVVKQMIDLYHDMLEKLAATPANNFILIDTRNIVTPDTSPTGWANEIHPRYAGFTALANKFLLSLRGKFPGRI